jgi:signal transduction histidine kinase
MADHGFALYARSVERSETSDRPLNLALGWRIPSWLLDFGPVAFLVIVALGNTYFHREGAVPGYAGLLVIAMAFALVVRHRWPLGVLAVLLALVLIDPYPALDVPVLFALFTVAEYLDRRRLAAAAVVAAIVLVIATPLHHGGLAFPGAISHLVAVGLAVAAGLYLRTRADYIIGLRERAARVERERELLSDQAVADERVRIARELHDVVAHNVSLMIVQAQALAATANGDGSEAEALNRIGDLGREAMSEMHRMLGVLRLQDDPTAEREPQPGVRDLEPLVSRARETGIQAELTVIGETRELAPGVDLSVYRIVQEALTNVIRHAQAEHVWIRLAYRPEHLEVEVVDDGSAAVPVPDAPSDGHGLVGMRERVGLLAGELIAGPRLDGPGYRVYALLPTA